MKLKYTLIILLILIICVTSIFIFDKESVHNATLEQLQEINGLGELLSSRVVIYLDTYPNADIDDLTDVEGIGEGKLELIKREWSD